MIINRNEIIKSTFHQKPIVTDYYYNLTHSKKPVIIFCHGYKGYKDWGAWDFAAQEFANNNFFFVKFNFSHNGGTVQNPIDFPDLESFGNNNFIKELNDLEDVINAVIGNLNFKNEADINNIILIGHSRGGGIVTIKASENKNISKVVTWSGVSNFGTRFPQGAQLQEWEQQGVSYILNARTKQKMPLFYQFYQNYKENEERLTIKTTVQKLKIPHLIVHGTNDEVVLPNEAINLHKWNPKSTLILVEGMNHPLGCTQPWLEEKMPIHLEKAIKLTIDFLNK
ncbi:S9 family peptidase [Lutibacter sp.]|uniref:alpha/beta hydrolase family protein n=1 Tax=Lutibacter sp. TaxID=1925666 RepID=UPI002736CED8|nr:alpha/beta fold hydrolase [Lutibacter sp.]MDP3314314.1 alpha/beta hydrolase fold domain-containing protein [Lutibacter sp.]